MKHHLTRHLQRTSLIVLCAFFSFFYRSVRAGDLEDGKKMLIYQRYERAEEAFNKIIKAGDPKNKQLGQAYYELVQTYLAEHKNAKAKTAAKAGMQALPASPWTMLALADVLLSSGQEAEAKPLFENALQQNKKKDLNHIIAILDAYAHTQNGNPEYILAKVRALSDKEKKGPMEAFYLALGDVYKRMRKANETYTNYQLAILKKDDFVEGHYKMARFFLTQGNDEGFVTNMEAAIKYDKKYAPAYYELYAYYYRKDVKKAREYFLQYKANTDLTPSVEYEEVSIYYAGREYDEAIAKAKALLDKYRANKTEDIRCYRLIGYSEFKLDHYADARTYMDSFFTLATQEDMDYLVHASDYKVMGDILDKADSTDNTAISYYCKAFELDTALNNKLIIASAIQAFAKRTNNLTLAANWAGINYKIKPTPSNTDLFRWGIATLKAERYQQGDSIFMLYSEKYPKEYFGYFWAARARTYLDTSMLSAIPLFEKAIVIAKAEDSVKNKTIIRQSYDYLFKYEVEKTHNYEKAITYLDKLIALAPTNANYTNTRADLVAYVEKQKEYEEKMRIYEEKKNRAQAAKVHARHE